MKKALFSVLFILSLSHLHSQDLSQQQEYENLVFEGAGIRGIAYSGVIKKLEEKGIMADIRKVGGTSAGAITSLMVALGYTSDEIYDIISETRFEKFNDGEMMFAGGLARLSRKFGWYRGNAFTRWLEQVISNKTGNADITFKELQTAGYKKLYVTATCLNRQKLLILSAETYPDMKIKDAVRISMSVPLYFEAVFVDRDGKVYHKPKKHQNLDIMVDGGITGNFPIFMFDSISNHSGHTVRIPNYHTIGVRIDSDEQIKSDNNTRELVPVPIYNLGDYMQAFYTIVLENTNRQQLTEDDWKRTLSVSSAGIGPKVKKMSTAQKQALIKSGEKHTSEFLNRNN